MRESVRQAEEDTSIPRWAKLAGLIAAVVVLLSVVAVLLGGGFAGHGPGRHIVSQGSDSATNAGSDEGGRHMPPEGAHK